MKREEAIKVLNMVEAHGLADEAKQMAISALEQMPEVTSTMQTGQFDYVRQPCEDAVSREDAIEAIASIDDTDGEVAVFTGKQVIAILKDLPSVTVRQTPCSLCRFREDNSGLCDMCPAMPLEKGESE